MNDDEDRIHPRRYPLGDPLMWLVSIGLWGTLGMLVYIWLAVVL